MQPVGAPESAAARDARLNAAAAEASLREGVVRSRRRRVRRALGSALVAAGLKRPPREPEPCAQ